MNDSFADYPHITDARRRALAKKLLNEGLCDPSASNDGDPYVVRMPDSGRGRGRMLDETTMDISGDHIMTIDAMASLDTATLRCRIQSRVFLVDGLFDACDSEDLIYKKCDSVLNMIYYLDVMFDAYDLYENDAGNASEENEQRIRWDDIVSWLKQSPIAFQKEPKWKPLEPIEDSVR